METLERTIIITNVFLTIFHCLALGLTAFRLHYRYRTGRLWWDDYLAASAAVLDIVAFIVLWIAYAPRGSHLNTFRSEEIIDSIGFMSVSGTDWTTRMSLALAFARIFPRGEPTRAYAIGLAIFFAMLLVSTVIQRVISCSKQSAWLSYAELVRCDLSTSAVIYTIAASVVADILLVCSPIYKLRGVKLPQSQRRLIFSCIAGSTLMTISCFVTSVFQIGPMSREPRSLFIRAVLGNFASGISVIVCNLLVVVTYLYTVTHKQQIVPQVNVEEPRTSPTISTVTHQSTVPPVVTSRSTTSGPMLTRLTLTEISGAYLTRTDTDCES